MTIDELTEIAHDAFFLGADSFKTKSADYKRRWERAVKAVRDALLQEERSPKRTEQQRKISEGVKLAWKRRKAELRRARKGGE